MMTTAKTLGLLTGLCLVIPLYAATPQKNASQIRLQGSEHEYNLRLEDALARFRQAVAADPGDPASYRALASAYLLRIAFQRGAITADDFLAGDARADSVQMAKPAPDLATGFHTNADRAFALAEQRVKTEPANADAHYQLAAAIGLMASYSATVDGKVFDAFKFARRAYKESERALELDPNRRDAGLILGVYEYVVSIRSLPVRWVAWVSGLDGDKSHAISMIDSAAKYPGENQTDAQVILALVYNRERRYDDALRVLTALQTKYPDNRLLWLESASTAIRAGRFLDAKRNLDLGIAKLPRNVTLRAFGEEALWRYKRGASLVGLSRDAEATADLKTVLRLTARDWVRARAHLELGKLADLKRDREAACQEYKMAHQLGKAANDDLAKSDAERFLAKPYDSMAASAGSSRQ